MNYYEHHLGDYIRDTAHLNVIEDCMYRRLLDAYYIRERALPTNLKECCKLARAASKQERDAVAYVLNEFFELCEDGHHQDRADREIDRFKDKQRKAKASAEARWSQHKTHSEGNANASQDAMRTHSEGNAHQTPVTRHQTVISESSGTHTEIYSEQGANPRATHPPPNQPGIAGACCKAMIDAGIEPSTCNPSHATLNALIGAGATPDEFGRTARECVGRGKTQFAYTLGTVKRRREEAAKLVLHEGALPNRQEALEQSNRAALAGWTPPEVREGERNAA